MFLSNLLAGGILLAVGGMAAAEAKGQADFTAGDWVGRVTQAPDGSASFCAVTKVSRDGSALILGLSAQNELEIGVFKVTWQLPVGDPFDLDISVDGETLGRYRTAAAISKMLRIPLGRNDEAYDRLSEGDRLRIAMAQEDVRFDLDGAEAALSAVRDCFDSSN